MNKKVLDEIKALRDKSTAEIGKGTFNALICGGVGTGKSVLFRTMVKPVLVFSFDPGGCKSKMLEPYIKKGELMVLNEFETEDQERPTAYDAFEKKYDEYDRMGLFDSIGTVCIDSFTTWWAALYNKIVRFHKVEKLCMSQPGYRIAGLTIIDWIKAFTALPCNFVMNSHLELVKDEVEGRMIARFQSIPSLKINVPLLFDEIYVAQSRDTSKGAEYKLLTQSTGRHEARTRIGGGVFDKEEPQDIKALMKKAGMDIKDKVIK